MESKILKLYCLETALVAHEYEILHVVELGKKPISKYYPKDGHPKLTMRFNDTKSTLDLFMHLLMR